MNLGRRLAATGFVVVVTAGVLAISAGAAAAKAPTHLAPPALTLTSQCATWPLASGTVTLKATNSNAGKLTLKASTSGQTKSLTVAGHKSASVSFGLKAAPAVWVHVTGPGVNAWKLTSLNCPVKFPLGLKVKTFGVTDCKGHATEWADVTVYSPKVGWTWVKLGNQPARLVLASPWGGTTRFLVANHVTYGVSASGNGYWSAWSKARVDYVPKVPSTCKRR